MRQASRERIMLKRSWAGPLAGALLSAALPTAVALAQASQVYAPAAYGQQAGYPPAQSYPAPAYQPTAPAYQGQTYPGSSPLPPADAGDYAAPPGQDGQGYRPPPPFNPAWVPQGYGANQALGNPAAYPTPAPAPIANPLPLPAPAAYAQPPRYAGGRFADWSDSDYRYRISAGDELSLRFLLNPDLNTGVLVGPDGRGVFPLISSVRVADMTVEEANSVLSQAYAQILRRPDVQVMITAYGASQVYVGGEVRTPGVYPIRGQLTPAQAVMMAGGLATTARMGRVAIIRQRPDGQMLMKVVDLQAYLAKGQSIGPFTILPGDLIFVPRSSIAEVDRFVDQYITGLLPLGRVLGYRDPTPRTY